LGAHPGDLHGLAFRRHGVDMRASINARFAQFRAENPRVEERLYQLTQELVSKGHTHLSIKMLWEFLRVEHLRAHSKDPYKYCNDYTSRYARLLMKNHPELQGVFDLREIKEPEPFTGRCLDVLVSDDVHVMDHHDAEIEDEYTPYLRRKIKICKGS